MPSSRTASPSAALVAACTVAIGLVPAERGHASSASPFSDAADPGPVPFGGLPRPLSAVEAQDLEEAAARLRHHVALIESRMPAPPEGHLSAAVVDGWAIVTDHHELRCQAFLVADAEEVEVSGPKGRASARVIALDRRLRVARLRTELALPEIGLHPSTPSPPEAREADMELLALVSTRPGSGVVSGSVTELGDAPHLEGNLRGTLRLERGMPVFDTQLRWVALARAVAWDRDRFMLIPVELTRIATSSTARSEPPPDAEPDRPWWAR